MALSALCLFLAACGLQNEAITSSSGSSIRTMHLTGLTTDLGLGLARLLTFDRHHEAFKNEARASQMSTSSIIAFSIGSAFGASTQQPASTPFLAVDSFADQL